MLGSSCLILRDIKKGGNGKPGIVTLLCFLQEPTFLFTTTEETFPGIRGRECELV